MRVQMSGFQSRNNSDLNNSSSSILLIYNLAHVHMSTVRNARKSVILKVGNTQIVVNYVT